MFAAQGRDTVVRRAEAHLTFLCVFEELLRCAFLSAAVFVRMK